MARFTLVLTAAGPEAGKCLGHISVLVFSLQLKNVVFKKQMKYGLLITHTQHFFLPKNSIEDVFKLELGSSQGSQCRVEAQWDSLIFPPILNGVVWETFPDYRSILWPAKGKSILESGNSLITLWLVWYLSDQLISLKINPLLRLETMYRSQVMKLPIILWLHPRTALSWASLFLLPAESLSQETPRLHEEHPRNCGISTLPGGPTLKHRVKNCLLQKPAGDLECTRRAQGSR